MGARMNRVTLRRKLLASALLGAASLMATLGTTGRLRAEDEAPAKAEEPSCPVAKPKAAQGCTAAHKSAAGSCDASAKEAASACARDRDECLEVERAARGVGPAGRSECLPNHQRCQSAFRRVRSVCVGQADDQKGVCADRIEVRSAHCELDAAVDEKAKEKACTPVCRAEGQAAVNDCLREEKSTFRRLTNERDEWRESCAKGEDPTCNAGADYLYEDGASVARGVREWCVTEAQKQILPCIRACRSSG